MAPVIARSPTAGRPPGTVRGWLRASAHRASALRLCGVLWTVALGEQVGRPRPAGSPLQDAVDALGSAVLARKLRFYDPRVSAWELMVALTGGLPVRPPTRSEPVY